MIDILYYRNIIGTQNGPEILKLEMHDLLNDLEEERKEMVEHIKTDLDLLLKECCEILGWQGGTIHQVIEEIKRLKKYNNHQGCKGCRYNVDEVDMWFPEKCPNCARSEREDLYESRLSV